MHVAGHISLSSRVSPNPDVINIAGESFTNPDIDRTNAPGFHTRHCHGVCHLDAVDKQCQFTGSLVVGSGDVRPRIGLQ